MRSILAELAAPPNLEASGVAAFRGALIIVNDKDNRLYIADPEAPGSPLTPLDVPDLPSARVKFEAIACHAASGSVFLIGAHIRGSPSGAFDPAHTRKVYRFELPTEEDAAWTPSAAEALPFSDAILEHGSGNDRVEGFAGAASLSAEGSCDTAPVSA